MKVGIYTLGCKVNTYESEYVMSLFKEKGYTISDFDDECDIYIINTCSVTNQSDSKSRKIINQAIRKNPHACIVAMGCFIEANKDIKIDGVDILIGNKDKSKVVELVEDYFKTKKQIVNLYQDLGNDFENMEIKTFEGRTRAFVKIQDGCENFCSYCIIPYVRGKCRSKKPEQVIEEISELVKNGYQEIVLTGIHTGNYGRDLNTDFASLLRKIVKIPNLYRLRISSIEITELTDEVLDIIENNEVVANHLHIPLQSGSNFILKNMNRKYDTKYFEEKINYIRSIRPSISISTDVIVGFPGETEEDFMETLSLVNECQFDNAFTFIYSPRENTPAAKLEDNVSLEEKENRLHRLNEVVNKYFLENNKKLVDTIVPVLVEGKNTNGKDGLYGYTDTNKLINFDGDESLTGKIVSIKVTDAKTWSLDGEICE